MVYTPGKNETARGFPSGGATPGRKPTAKRPALASENLPQVRIYVGFAIAQRPSSC